MIESGYYPAGAEYDKNAPYNKADKEEKEIEVTVSITLSKTIKVKVSDYEIEPFEKNEDGDYTENIDYSNCNLEEAVREQIHLPHEAGNLIRHCMIGCINANKVINDLTDWNVDEFEVIKD